MLSVYDLALGVKHISFLVIFHSESTKQSRVKIVLSYLIQCENKLDIYVYSFILNTSMQTYAMMQDNSGSELRSNC